MPNKKSVRQRKSSGRGQTAVASATRRGQRAPKPAPFAPDAALTGTFLDELPLGTTGMSDVEQTTERIAYVSTRSVLDRVTFFVRLQAEQWILSQSLAGNSDSAPTTDHLNINGVERYCMNGRKVHGVMRTFISKYMRNPACSDSENRNGMKGQCGRCFVCRLFGHFANKAQSRIIFTEFYSEQSYKPDVIRTMNVSSDKSFVRAREMIPPGTSLWGLITIRKPSKIDLATTIAALDIVARSEGFGSETTHNGRAAVDVQAVVAGYLMRTASSVGLVERVYRGMDREAAVREVLGAEPYKPDMLIGEEAAIALDKIARLSPLHPGFGEE